MRVATAIAGGLAAAAAGMAVVAFAAGGDDGGGTAGKAGKVAATPAPSGAAAARDGLAVWAEQGCGSCHTLAAANAHGTIGPDLASSLKGMPVAYIKESIVAPGKTAAAGYSAGTMPEDYAARIAPGDLDRLVRFLAAGARR